MGVEWWTKRVQIGKSSEFEWQRPKLKFQMNIKCQMLKKYTHTNSNTAHTGGDAQWEKGI